MNQFSPKRLLFEKDGILHVPLTRGFVALVSPEDRGIVEGYNWSALVSDYAPYAVRGSKKLGKLIYMHAEILKPQEGQDCDHINGNRLDNRRENLRACTHAENCRNNHGIVTCREGRSSRFAGVTKDHGKWSAKIKLDGKCIYLGYFSSEEEAAKARREAELKYFGEFAVAA